MEELLKSLDFDKDEIDWMINELENIGYYQVEGIIKLLLKHNCSNDFIKEILFNHRRVIKIDLERINYIIEAILANGDIIEETLLELV